MKYYPATRTFPAHARNGAKCLALIREKPRTMAQLMRLLRLSASMAEHALGTIRADIQTAQAGRGRTVYEMRQPVSKFEQ